jgi:uncharacterized membrane protein
MQISNPFQMNDWEIKKFLKVVLAVQLAIWSVIGLDATGFQIPLLRQFIGFIYLSFIPGILILRILKLHKLGNIETILYTVGLSIATLMFTGLLVNTIYPLFGISGPISITPLIITISAVVLILCTLSYLWDKDFSNPSYIDIGAVLSPPVLFLCLIPFMSVCGAYLVNYHNNNFLLMLLIVVLAFIPILIAFDKFIPKNLYPLAVFIIAISLLFHNSLISMYLWGWDIHYEYHISSIVAEFAHWDSTIISNVNGMLSIVMVAPIYSNILNLDRIWIFKIIYPFIFSLVPLGLYRIFQKQTEDKIAFLSCFFFVSLFSFYSEMLQLARQQIAELFFALLILLMVSNDMNKAKRAFLFIIFGLSLVVSHYGLSYIYIFSLILAWLLLLLTKNPEIKKMIDIFHHKVGRYNKKHARNPKTSKIEERTISSTFVLLMIVFTLAWYIYITGSSSFQSFLRIGEHIVCSFTTDFLDPQSAQGAEYIIRKAVSWIHSVHKYLQLLMQFLIVVGIVSVIVKYKEMKFEKEYFVFSVIAFTLCLTGITVPHFATAYNTTRIYQITLFFLAPFCVIGGIAILKILSEIAKMSWTGKSSLKVLSVIFAIYLLFNSGWVYAVTEDNPQSFALNNKGGDYICSNEREAIGSKWLSRSTDDDSLVYGDLLMPYIIADFFHVACIGRRMMHFSGGNFERMSNEGYIYLRSWNIEKHEIRMVNPRASISELPHINIGDVPELVNKINRRNKVYTNGGAQIFAP